MDLPNEYVLVYSAIALIIIENLIEIYYFHRVSEVFLKTNDTKFKMKMTRIS